MWLRSTICCCFKCGSYEKATFLKKYDVAKELLQDELDIVNLIRLTRLAKFVAMGMTNPHHWHLIEKFDQYCIKGDADAQSSDGFTRCHQER